MWNQSIIYCHNGEKFALFVKFEVGQYWCSTFNYIEMMKSQLKSLTDHIWKGINTFSGCHWITLLAILFLFSELGSILCCKNYFVPQVKRHTSVKLNLINFLQLWIYHLKTSIKVFRIAFTFVLYFSLQTVHSAHWHSSDYY